MYYDLSTYTLLSREKTEVSSLIISSANYKLNDLGLLT